MPNHNQQIWLTAGYELFAKEGPRGLKVEVIARKVKKSKSSFYHYFADIEVFTEILLGLHLERAKDIARRESLCKNIDPDLIALLLDVKQDLLFNRQLRIHRNVPLFSACFEKVNQTVESTFIELWKEHLELNDNNSLAFLLFKLLVENFYLQITDETLTLDWLQNYFREIRLLVRDFKNIK